MRFLSAARRVLRAVVLLACIGLSACTSVFLYPDRVQHLPHRALETTAEDVWLTAPDGSTLHALYLPAPGAARATLLYLHGNAENLSSHIHAVSWLPAQAYNVLALDYRGFGRSQGAASIDAVHQDAASALAWLLAREADRDLPLIVYGQSLGGSVAVYLVAHAMSRERIVAVVAESPFASYRGVARDKLAELWLTWPLQWPLSCLISDRYAAVDAVADLSPIPLLLIHGERDVVVDARHSQSLYAAAREPRQLWLIPEGGHIDATRRPAVRARLLEFLAIAIASNRGAAPLEKSAGAHTRG